MSLCLWHLARQARTRGELHRALRKHLVPEDICESVLDQMADYGYIDDAAYSAAFVRSRMAQRKAGPVIARELARKGVDRDVVAEALSQFSQADEQENAEQLAAARVRSMRHLPQEKQIARLVGVLSRRGYSPSVAWSVARETVRDAS